MTTQSLGTRFSNLLAASVQVVSPVLVPLFVLLCLGPLVCLLSVYAGWIVWSSVAVSWRVPLHLQYGDGVPPYAQLYLDNLVPHQHYEIGLQLRVPTTVSNLALGNFMASFTLSTANNDTVAFIRHPAMLVLPPLGIFSFLRSNPSIVDLNIPLLQAFASRSSKLLAKVELGRLDNWKSLGNGQGREISVISASLNGFVRYHGIRGLVMRFPIVFAIMSAIVFLVTSFSIIATCILPTIRWNHIRSPIVLANHETSVDVMGDSSDEEKPIRRRRREKGKKSNSRSRHEESASEGPSKRHQVKIENDSGAKLRRRQSRNTSSLEAENL